MAGKNRGDQEPLIIIKKVKSHGQHHGGAWKVAYADFVTAMMALFIVLWLLSASQEVQKAVGGYFNDPTGDGRQTGTTKAGIGEALQVEPDDLEKLKEQIEKAMAQEIEEFSLLKKNVTLTITPEGLRIELLEGDGGVFFENGSATPTGAGAAVFRELATELGALPNVVVIEGHTDSRPFVGATRYTNWELSTDRANSARRLMHDFGLRPSQVEQVRGYADQQLRKPEAPEDSSNRRISILVRRRGSAEAQSVQASAPSGESSEASAATPGASH
jgi:chemotaxis protein MotB